MPKLSHRLTAQLGAWTTLQDRGLGAAEAMVTAVPRGQDKPGEVLLAIEGRSYVLRVDWETLVNWGCAEACEAPGDPVLYHSGRTVSGELLEVGDSPEHGATPENEHAVAIVRLPVDQARRAAAFIGRKVWLTRWP